MANGKLAGGESTNGCRGHRDKINRSGGRWGSWGQEDSQDDCNYKSESKRGPAM